MTEQPNVETQAWRERVERLAFWIDRIASEESLQGRGNDEYFDINVRTSQLWNLHQAKDALTTQIEERDDRLGSYERMDAERSAQFKAAVAQIEELERGRDRNWGFFRVTEARAEAAERDLASSQQAALLLHKRLEELVGENERLRETLDTVRDVVEGWSRRMSYEERNSFIQVLMSETFFALAARTEDTSDES